MAGCDDLPEAAKDGRISAGHTAFVLWSAVARRKAPAWLSTGIKAVFREAATRWPADPAAADAFTELWLESYLREEPDLALVALEDQPGSEPRVVGYLVASTADPLTDPRFATLGYFHAFADELAAFPAHLHVNVASDRRGLGIGERLVTDICNILAARGCPGVHIVTGKSARNVAFYRRLGFLHRAEANWKDRELVLMGCALPRRAVQT
ncbi:MAG TPA: GNAT family N-acetyltransferase [Hyphomicrobiaceae bacterium]|nr:GNAT family N-acetyltransferase [Hyphomicrobiaceae bacterium]